MKRIILTFATMALCLSSLFAQDNTVDGRTVRVASSEASDAEKAHATYICTGHNDQDVIQKAIEDLCAKGGGNILLTQGKFYIDAFTHKSSIDYAAIEIPQKPGCEIRISGDVLSYRGHGTELYVRDDVYEALDPQIQYTILRAGEVDATINSKVSLQARNLRITLPWNQRKICCLDMLWVNRVFLEAIQAYGYRNGYKGGWNVALTNPPAVAVEGCVGLRSTGGSNSGTYDDYRNLGMNGFYEAYKLAGEHLVGINLSAIFNVYGFTFGNFPWTCGSNHPITLINCCDERDVNLPLFVANGEWNVQEKFGYSGQQAITFIDFNMERIAAYTPGGKLGDYAKEVHPGTFRGSIEYTIQDIYSGHGNCVDMPFWEPGSGHEMKTRNQAQRQSCDTKTRLSYAPNYMQQIYDTDLKKVVFCIDPANKVWIDANGNEVDKK